MKNQELVTMYYGGSFGVQKCECKLIDFGTKPYAQYKDAAYVKYVPKGKRKPCGFVLTSYPFLIIIEGVNHPNPADSFGPSKTTHYDSGSVVTKETRFSSFDERYKTEFDSNFEEYLKDKTVIMDVRHTVRTNIINK